MDGVEALVKKHEDFEKSLAAQEEKVKVSFLWVFFEGGSVIIVSVPILLLCFHCFRL